VVASFTHTDPYILDCMYPPSSQEINGRTDRRVSNLRWSARREFQAFSTEEEEKRAKG